MENNTWQARNPLTHPQIPHPQIPHPQVEPPSPTLQLLPPTVKAAQFLPL